MGFNIDSCGFDNIAYQDLISENDLATNFSSIENPSRKVRIMEPKWFSIDDNLLGRVKAENEEAIKFNLSSTMLDAHFHMLILIEVITKTARTSSKFWNSESGLRIRDIRYKKDSAGAIYTHKHCNANDNTELFLLLPLISREMHSLRGKNAPILQCMPS